MAMALGDGSEEFGSLQVAAYRRDPSAPGRLEAVQRHARQLLEAGHRVAAVGAAERGDRLGRKPRFRDGEVERQSPGDQIGPAGCLGGAGVPGDELVGIRPQDIGERRGGAVPQQRLQRVRDVNPLRPLLVLDFWSHANNKRSWFDKLL